jgi:alanine racemase
MSSTLTISESNLRHNVHAAQRILGETTLLAVIKADAYGHSATRCAPILVRAGVQWLGVTDAQEGAKVRAAAGPTPRILIMTAPPGDPGEAREAAKLTLLHDLTPIVSAADQLTPLAEAAAPTPHTLPLHVEIDTGMSRQGVPPGPKLHVFLAHLKRHPRLRLDGLCTHLASAEWTDSLQTQDQIAAFEQACGQVHRAGLLPPWIHIGNTSTLDNASPAAAAVLPRLIQIAGVRAQPMARCGLALYGYSLPLAPDTPAEARLRPTLRPVLTWTTTITAIEQVPAGTRIGYSATYTAPRPMRLALLPVGYADGLRRALSSTNAQPGGWVMIHGQRAPIAGRISMNLTTVDVTGIEAQPGTPVTLLGEGITAEDHARLAGCIPYEILCGLKATRHAVLTLPPAH